jgi:hypothetical protein
VPDLDLKLITYDPHNHAGALVLQTGTVIRVIRTRRQRCFVIAAVASIAREAVEDLRDIEATTPPTESPSLAQPSPRIMGAMHVQ